MEHLDTNGPLPRVVIVGGGFAGLEVAKNLRKAPVEVLLLDKHNYHTFQPLLYQVASGGIEAESIAFPIRRIFSDQKNFVFRMAEVQRIEAEQNILHTEVGPIRYDYLVIATGADTNFFGNEEIKHYSMPMKSIPEALNLRSLILQNLELALVEKDPEKKKALMTFVVVGGGPTGVELSGSLGELRNKVLVKEYPELDPNEMRVFLVEGKPRVLGTFSEQASAKAARFLRKMGVDVSNGVHVKSYDGYELLIDDGRCIRTRNVLWSAGVMGALPPGITNGAVVRGNRLQTDAYFRVKGFNNVFAIGDVSVVVTEATPEGYPGVAQVAIQEGGQLAKNIARLLKNEPLKPFKYFDKGSLATIGRNKAVADLGFIRFQGFFAWLVWMFVHLMSLVGARNRLIVFINWAGSYFTFNSITRLIIRRFDRGDIEQPAPKPAAATPAPSADATAATRNA
ncbi:NAD(P)/FAD-dependent oxidoreductase [Chitinophaga costaii]|nr:NAD(P)/FAD-dependent oxidoreductase [Chitinophaga costaii]